MNPRKVFLIFTQGDGSCHSVTAMQIRMLWVFGFGFFGGFLTQHFAAAVTWRARRASAAPARYPGATAGAATHPSSPAGGPRSSPENPDVSVKILMFL